MRHWREIVGWLTEKEGEALARLAAGGVVLEVGSYFGRSTVCMAKTARMVYAVDPHTGETITNKPPHDTLPTFLENLQIHGVRDKVMVHIGLSRDLLPILTRSFDLVFIDGNHDERHARFDIDHALRLAKSGGAVAVHDYQGSNPRHRGVTAAVNQVLKGYQITQIGSLAIVRVK